MSTNTARAAENESRDPEARACTCTWGKAVTCGWADNARCPYASRNRKRDIIVGLGVVAAGLATVVAVL